MSQFLESSLISHGRPTLAPDGRCIATPYKHGSQITIIQTADGQIIRSAAIHERVRGRIKFLQWTKSSFAPSHIGSISGAYCGRLLCASGNHVSVLDVHDKHWSAEIDVGEGISFAHVDFTASPNEVLVLSEFALHLTIFLLDTGEQRVIKSPKFSSANTYALRPKTGHLAVLLKIESGDLLTIHEPGTYEVISKASIPTVDAQGLKWSPNGAWLAVWDAASAGTTVAIYTADGQHFRTYSAEAPETDFGVRTVEWSHDSSLLAIGKHDGTVDLINGTTFTLRHVLGDPTTFRPIGRDVYVERTAGGSGTREYVLAPESPVFPYTYKTPSGSRAVSSISFNPSNSFVATIDQALPHIVWQWAITGETKPRLVGALVQRSSIQQLLWNPELPELLMTTTDESFAFVHQWICGSVPRAVAVQWSGGKFSTSWIKSSEASSGLIWVGCPSGYAMGYLTGSGSSTKFSRIACLEDRYVPLEPYDFPPTQ